MEVTVSSWFNTLLGIVSAQGRAKKIYPFRKSFQMYSFLYFDTVLLCFKKHFCGVFFGGNKVSVFFKNNKNFIYGWGSGVQI